MKRIANMFGVLAVLLLLALPLAASAEEVCNHEWAEIPTAAPTCTKPGTTGGQRCSKCGFVLTEPTPNAEPTGHNYMSVNDQIQKCSKCNEVIDAPATDVIVNTGTCGENAQWYLTAAGKLVVYGTGTAAADGLPDKSASALVVKGGIVGIAEGAFRDFSSLTTVTVADSVQSIGTGAFRGCNSIQSMTLPFTGTSRTGTYIDGVFGSIFGYAGDGESTTGAVAQYEYGGSRYFYIPSSIRSVTITSASCIGAAAFENMRQLTSLSLNKGIDTLDPLALRNCSGLTVLTIPSTVTDVEGGAFEGCTGLTELTFPANLEKLGNNAFNKCDNLQKLTFLGNVPKTAAGPFQWYNGVISYPCQYNGWKSAYFVDCEAVRIPAHPEDGIVPVEAVAPTCTETGLTAGEKCKVCSEATVEQTEIEALGHEWEKEYTTDTEPTCTETGSKSIHCSRCDGKNDVTAIEAQGHDWAEEYTTDIEPACEKEGSKSRHCSRCEEKDDITAINALGHSKVTDAAEEPTATTHGKTGGSHCDRCNEVIVKQEVIHNYEIVHGRDATCTEDGCTEGTRCTVCGEILDGCELIEKLGHQYGDDNICTVCGQKKPEAKSVELSAKVYTYDGKVKTPTVTVKDADGKVLVEGEDYTVTYPAGRKNVGKYTVTVNGKGSYSFTKTLDFTIKPVKTAIAKLTAGQKSFTAKWGKKTGQVTGYEIQYSLKKNMSGKKTVAVKKNTTVSKTFKNLKAGKTYYARIRTYKVVDGVKYYSDWSALKKVKTKK